MPSFTEFQEIYRNRVLYHYPEMSDFDFNEMFKEIFKKKDNMSCTLPSNDGLRYQYMHVWCTYLHLTSLRPVIPNTSVVYQLGYAPIDKTKDPCVSNTCMNFNTSAQRPELKCVEILKTGKNKGKPCGKPVKYTETSRCTIHHNQKRKLEEEAEAQALKRFKYDPDED